MPIAEKATENRELVFPQGKQLRSSPGSVAPKFTYILRLLGEPNARIALGRPFFICSYVLVLWVVLLDCEFSIITH